MPPGTRVRVLLAREGRRHDDHTATATVACAGPTCGGCVVVVVVVDVVVVVGGTSGQSTKIVAATEAWPSGPKTTEPVTVEPNTRLPNTAGGASPACASTSDAVTDAPLDAMTMSVPAGRSRCCGRRS